MIAAAARRIAQGSNEMLELGDIAVEKEWTFAGDIVEGMFALVTQDQVFEATIGSGEAHSIRDWLGACFGVVDLDWRAHVKILDGYIPEYRRLISDPATMRALGW